MKQEMTINEQNSKIEQFIALFKAGVDAWIKAGEILVSLVEADPHAYDYLIQKCPTLNPGILGRFEQMGRKILHPQLLITSSPGFSRLQKLPYSLQERFIDEPIPLIVETDNGPDVLLVKARDMTADQAAQVFNGDRMRTEGEQRAWRLDQRQRNAVNVTPRENRTYVIKNGKAIIGGIEFTGKQLLMIASEITR